jgi:hypothetical protein
MIGASRSQHYREQVEAASRVKLQASYESKQQVKATNMLFGGQATR